MVYGIASIVTIRERLQTYAASLELMCRIRLNFLGALSIGVILVSNSDTMRGVFVSISILAGNDLCFIDRLVISILHIC